MDNSDSQMFTVGEITGVHGIKGYLKIRSFAEATDLFSPGAVFFLGMPGKKKDRFVLIRATSHKKGLIALFEGVTREIAENLVGREIAVERDALPELEPDTYYWEDLIGIRVMDVRRGYIGNIDHVMPTGSNDVFVVKLDEREVLVPALAWIVLAVDLDSGEMSVDMPDELMD